jgi:transcriptional regulator with PAS, ATPase and Fis domain
LFDPSAPLSLEHRADLFALLARELERLRAPRLVSGFAGLVGNSPPMRELFRLLEKVAESDATVLIQGENGTGKGRLAQAIHQRSHRKDGPFLAQNCSALNDNLLDSELFGHKRGSFTGAIQDKPGLFTVADGGTFFLDEVGDTSPRLQVKLLRVLEEGSFLPIGETSPRRVSVRVIAATNRNLQRMVEAGSFREDLYFRLHVLRVVVPPLRERREDIPLLIDHFLQKLQGREEAPPKQLSAACERRLLSYSWPGNVRELENELNRLWVLSGDASEIDTRWLSPRIQGEAAAAPLPTLPAAVETLERRMIAESLRRHRQNKTHAAQELGISRRNLIRLCQRYGFDSAGD